jgi:hypothetical protein
MRSRIVVNRLVATFRLRSAVSDYNQPGSEVSALP